MAFKKIEKSVKATAKCASFDIHIQAVFIPRGLASHEVSDVQRKLKQNLTDAIAKLPFAHVYPCEVKIQ